ncbi:MAG: helicase-exonuclease AddAB subunit AddA [Bacillota bacterium]|nr:helicase-exonuclease AddAB subunit AddA [Bacillota bacterium]MDW7683521.1 helicase-exonuclease AddAB subunit AddA [Bacillota bacterium]
MSNKWTEEQQAAILTRDCNLLISAAAGAGKTAVLVERIIRLLCDRESPTDIDRMLVVTFTEAAAAEMRERIGAALEKEIAQSGRPELARQLSLLNGASICTLHSFCLDVIRRYFYLLDIDPGFRVADGLEVSMLQQDILDDLMEESFAQSEAGPFLELVSRYGGKTADEGLARLVLRLYRYSWSNTYPQGWLAEAAAAFTVPDARAAGDSLEIWLAPLRGHLRQSLARAVSLLERAQQLCRLPGGPLAYETVLTRETEQLLQLVACLDDPWDKLRENWLGTEFKRLPPAKDADDSLKEQVQDLRGGAKDEIKASQSAYFTRTLDDYLAEVRSLAPLVSELADLVNRFAVLYTAEKKKLGIVDFNDLEHYCLAILTDSSALPGEPVPSAAAGELRERYEFVLVDEYQDINPVQDAIIQLVSRQDSPAPNLFMVGDVKQSIYRFRMGDPALFLSRYHTFPAADGGPQQKLLLSKNFRCRESIVSAVNYIFRQLMTEQAAEIEYDSVAELVCGAQYPDVSGGNVLSSTVEFHLVERNADEAGTADENGDDTQENLSALEREGVIAASRIQELIGNGKEAALVFDKELESYRPLGYRDIVILLRATSNRADKLVDLLGRFGIPAYAELTSGYFAATEVETMISLLKILDNPCQDIPLAAVLRSPLVGLDTQQLAAIRESAGRNDDFFTAVRMAAAADIPELSQRLADFLVRIERWRDIARREKLAAFIAMIYRESGFADYVAGLSNGTQRQANLRALFHRARQFDRFSRQGLHRFLGFIDQLRSSGEDLGAAPALGEREDVVRIMSIHKAKGLEFPVVILCDLGKQFNFQDQRTDMLVHRRLGFGPLIVNPSEKVRYPSLPYLTLKLLGEAETRAEEMRILYVALTRAREKLILLGSAKTLSGELSSWRSLLDHSERKLPPSEIMRARSLLDWLGPALIRHPALAGVGREYAWQKGDSARFEMHIHESGLGAVPEAAAAVGLPEDEVKNMLTLRPLPQQKQNELHQQIRERLQYRYPYTAPNLPAKLSVSEVKRRIADDTDESTELIRRPWAKPSFLQKKTGPDPMEKGTVYHLVMQHLDLSRCRKPEDIAGQIRVMAEKQILTPDQARYPDPQKIARFFSSAAGKEVLQYQSKTYREWPFTLSLRVDEILPEAGSHGGEAVVIQGIIDLLLQTPQGYIIVDYKTDRMPAGGTDELRDRYREQIRYYALAVETVLKRPVTAAYLYFFEAAECLRVR